MPDPSRRGILAASGVAAVSLTALFAEPAFAAALEGAEDWGGDPMPVTSGPLVVYIPHVRRGKVILLADERARVLHDSRFVTTIVDRASKG
ncbi:MAG: hypothetical protein IPL94_12160 [Tetrasphaera sp.]|nr:hypothetical protein [Tetrasphaera sp.]